MFKRFFLFMLIILAANCDAMLASISKHGGMNFANGMMYRGFANVVIANKNDRNNELIYQAIKSTILKRNKNIITQYAETIGNLLLNSGISHKKKAIAQAVEDACFKSCEPELQQFIKIIFSELDERNLKNSHQSISKAVQSAVLNKQKESVNLLTEAISQVSDFPNKTLSNDIAKKAVLETYKYDTILLTNAIESELAKSE